MFQAIAGIAGRFFGTDKAAESLVENTSRALDKIWYTEEEKADDRARSASEARAMIIDWMRATSGQNLARRVLAMAICFTWLSMFGLAGLMKAISPWVRFVPDKELGAEISKALQESAASVGADAVQMSGAVMLILGFYFAAPHLGSIVGVAMERFKGKAPAVPPAPG